MNTHNWLTLMEYSAKHRISLSTLRRRIKAGEIEFQLVEGKYLLKDGSVASRPETIAPPQPVRSQAVEPTAVSETTQALLTEIKKAYSTVLASKEDQILQLKEEVADLKTLVRVLEDENTRMRNLQPRLDFDLGLEI